MAAVMAQNEWPVPPVVTVMNPESDGQPAWLPDGRIGTNR